MTHPRHFMGLPVVCLQCEHLYRNGNMCYCDKRYHWPSVWALVCNKYERRKGLASVQDSD